MEISRAVEAPHARASSPKFHPRPDLASRISSPARLTGIHSALSKPGQYTVLERPTKHDPERSQEPRRAPPRRDVCTVSHGTVPRDEGHTPDAILCVGRHARKRRRRSGGHRSITVPGATPSTTRNVSQPAEEGPSLPFRQAVRLAHDFRRDAIEVRVVGNVGRRDAGDVVSEILTGQRSPTIAQRSKNASLTLPRLWFTMYPASGSSTRGRVTLPCVAFMSSYLSSRSTLPPTAL